MTQISLSLIKGNAIHLMPLFSFFFVRTLAPPRNIPVPSLSLEICGWLNGQNCNLTADSAGLIQLWSLL